MEQKFPGAIYSKRASVCDLCVDSLLGFFCSFFEGLLAFHYLEINSSTRNLKNKDVNRKLLLVILQSNADV